MSRADEAGARGLAVGWQSPAEAISELQTQHQIGKTVAEIVKRSAIPDTASMIPAKPSPLPPAERGSGWIKEIPIGMPGGATTQHLIEEMCDAALPHGVKPKR